MTEKDYDKLKQIEVAIQSFNSEKLYESSLALYKALDYTSNKTARISPATFDGFMDSFNLPKNAINKDKAFVSHWKQIEFIFQIADSEIARVQSLSDTGEVDRNEYQSFLFFTIQLKEDSYKRSELVKITRELNLPFKMPVIVLFHYGNKLTLSIIDRRLNKTDSSKDVLEKVTLIKDIDITHPQRAHKEILKDLSLNELYRKFEFHSFVKLHEAWKATLNISELNKKFFNELANWYFWATTQVAFPDDEIENTEIRNATGVIRLITRLMFVWFLKEKNLVPEDLFDEKKLKTLLKYTDKNNSTYYKAILQNLFFATLNTEMGKRKFRSASDKSQSSHYFIHNLFRYENEFFKPKETLGKYFDPIPFLNGGLFECLDKQIETNGKLQAFRIDGFSDREDNVLKVPDELFFSEKEKVVDLSQVYGMPKKSKEKVRGLIDILSSYKFTIAENTPIEEEVALDPELLGKVFENLLASYNPETKTTARKQTGSFYTPREIVNYMVDESLLAYLKSTLTIPGLGVDQTSTPGQGVDPKQDTFETFFNPNNEVQIHQGNLPHWQQENVWYFITFRLADSIPASVAEQIKSDRELWLKKHRSKVAGNNTFTTESRSRDASETYTESRSRDASETYTESRSRDASETYTKNRSRDASETYTKEELKEYYRLFSERVETLLNAGKGSCVLKDKANAEIVANALLHFNHQRYELDEWVIMPNHVHVLVKPLGENKLPDILHSWKSFTANKINERIGIKGQLWMHESYDHIVRNEKAFLAIRNYIRQNPVKAGLSAGSFLASDDSTGSFLASEENRSRDASETMIRNLLSYSEEEIQFSNAEKEQLIHAIDNIKILDPACGSGAFPMGILHKLVHTLHKLDPKNELWKQRQIAKASTIDDAPSREAAIATIEEAFENNELDYGRKLYLIENCIYGVDIQPIAVQISKLRFFISLIVDQKVFPASRGKENLGIRPLPNLETKFVAANTLIALDKPKLVTGDLFNINYDIIQKKKEELKRVRHSYFEARTPKRKQSCRESDKQLRNELTKLLSVENMPKTTAETMAAWNPYDQNASADFFDTEWMFGLKDGFDVVIGNPPYVQMQKDNGKLAVELKSQNYKTYERTGDLYAIFYEKGINILREGGIETFITSSQWMKAAYGKSLRKYFLSKNPLKLVLLGPGVFESATVDTNIIVIQNAENKKQLAGATITDLQQLNEPANLDLEFMPYVSEETWAISDLSKQIINEKLKAKGKPLKQWRVKINFGIKTGFNEAFIIEEDKRKELIKADAGSKEIIRPVLRGREIEKYATEWDGDYLISTFPALGISINKYKAVKKYLESFQPKLNQTGETFINEEGKQEKTRKKTSNKWFETQDQIGYYKELSKEKLIWKRIGSQLRFSYSAKEIYCLDSTCIATGEKIKYLACLLNSKLCNYQLFENAPKTGMGDLIISVQALEPLLVYYPNEKEENIFNQLLDFILLQKKNGVDFYEIENVINGCVYELYFGEEMKKAGVAILALVENDLEAVKKLSPEKAIAKLYEKWQEPKNEVRNRLLLMATRCPDTIGVIEASVN